MLNRVLPNINGLEQLKEAVLLQLLSDINILLIGECPNTLSYILKHVGNNFDFVKCVENIKDEQEFTQSPILAYATPNGEKFNLNQPLEKQINLDKKLLNKFDIVFLIRGNDSKYLLLNKDNDSERFRNDVFSMRKFCIKPQANLQNKINTILKENNLDVGNIKLNTIKKISIAHARINNRNEVLDEDINSSIKFLASCNTFL